MTLWFSLSENGVQRGWYGALIVQQDEECRVCPSKARADCQTNAAAASRAQEEECCPSQKWVGSDSQGRERPRASSHPRKGWTGQGKVYIPCSIPLPLLWLLSSCSYSCSQW